MPQPKAKKMPRNPGLDVCRCGHERIFHGDHLRPGPSGVDAFYVRSPGTACSCDDGWLPCDCEGFVGEGK